ncbi:MAG: right-handed parallel beta-helix repeat-containing protein [Prosthecobacter sp.]|uniref:right-handed parallel beta-helix repeat-containing protein n=1 Tax=Prosthecobacter sp. TaxID=1965333 RepID=UPI0026155EDD|nr:right-handed parallel beta-helix repeat-containing protein [Prosthecobacter sp.]MCF7789041.1 right-handed parallel beta-helix repeat-containing protein [Prosthecobacter sp.]
MKRFLLCLMFAGPLLAAERPGVTVPRQTSGDVAVQPKWEEGLRITVGLKDADIVGGDQRAIQAAVDYVGRLGGGTVHIKAGTYRLRNAVYLQTGVNLTGEGDLTVLIKEPSAMTPLKLDSDWYDQEITLHDASGFRVGDGVCLRAKDAKTGRQTVIKRTLVARSGNRFKLDKALRENLWQMNEATCATLFPLLSGELVNDVRIENLVLDGNREHNAKLDGNYAGCIFLQDCNRFHISGVTARNNHGDGISWQICHDVVVENCVSENNSGLGLHPGSGSQRPIIRNSTLRGNDIGIFFCWGVKYGLAEGNQIEGNRIGISIGHRDTDNLVTGNTIRGSKVNGLLFRPERGPDFAGHRNRIEKNRFIDNAPEAGAVIDIQGGTEAITISDNEFKETRGGKARVAVKQGPETKRIVIEGSQSQGF